MRSWNYKLLCGAVCLAQLACLSLPVWAAQNSAAFTRQTTLQQLRDDPAIKSSGYYTYCRELSGLGNEYWKNKTLEQYMRPELVDDSVAAMNLVAENTRNGVQVTWQVYSPEEIAADSSLGCVQLFWFPGTNADGKYALVVGGNAAMKSGDLNEGIAVAAKLNKMGYSVFVLRYRILWGISNNGPLQDLGRAVQFITNHAQQIAFNSLSIIAGNALYALTVVLFLVPSGLITGGATGIALGVNRVLGLPVSGVLFAINISMLVLGWMVLGSRFALTTIASTILSPLFLAMWERVFADFVLTDDLVLNTIFAGLDVGISLGITIRAGASTGGMDIPPLVLNKWFHLPVSATMMVFDLIILAVQAAFSPLQQCLYGIVMVIVYTVVLDKVLIFGSTRTEVKIISQHADEIREAIFSQLDRGVTILHGEGGYSRNSEQVLLSVVSNRQLPKLEKIAHLIDPTCFMIVSHVTEVSGRGFSLEKDYKEEG